MLNALRRTLHAAPRAVAVRSFASSPASRKTVTETVKDAASQLNRTVSDGVLKGIETTEAATEAIKEKAAPLADKVKDIAGDAATQAKQSGADASNVANKAASDVKTEASKAGSAIKNEADKASR
ncbi:hypothetical protein RQP46_007065 [Phenoliferia psychrophenolica]